MPSGEQAGGAAPPLKADFDFAPACPTEGSTVQFWDRSAGSPAAWAWKIEKEAISSSPGASHDFEEAGVYTVSLTVTKDGQSQTATKSVRVANQVITFYSYKGGVGRSMALANVGCLLADRKGDKGVLLVDWDLEAPGLHRFFRDQIKLTLPPGKGVDEVVDAKPGLIDLFIEVEAALRKGSPTTPASDDEVRKAFDRIALDPFVMETGVPALRLMKAGRFDDGSYSRRVNTFQWEELYKRYPSVIRGFAERLTKEYRYVLIDSRTGLTDISGICTMLMPEKLVVVFTPNRQSLTGVIDLVRRASTYRRESDDLRPLLVFPLPSRIENARPALRELWRSGDGDSDITGYQPQFEKLFEEVYQLPACELSEYFDEVQIQQVPDYAYGEEIAVRVEGRRDRLSLTRSYSAFAERLVDSPAPWVAPPVPVASQVASPSQPQPETRLTPLDAVRVSNLAPGSMAEPPAEAQAPARLRRVRLVTAAVALLAVAVISVFVLKKASRAGPNAQPTQGSLPATTTAAVAPTAVAVAPPPPTREAGVPARQLASRAMALLRVGTQGPELPLLLSVEALRKSDTFETRSALFAALEATPKFGAQLTGVGGDVLALAFPEGGRTLLALGPRQGLAWEVESQAVAGKFNMPSGGARKATVSANGQILAVATSKEILVTEITTLQDFVRASAVGERSKSVALPQRAEVLGLALSRTGDVLAVANGDGNVTLWDRAGNLKEKIVVDRARSEFTIAISSDGKILASGGTDGKITLWDLTHSPAHPMGTPMGGPASAAEAFRPSGSLEGAANRIGGRRGGRLLWASERSSSTQQKRSARQSPRMAFSPGGKLLAASSADNSILLWDIAKREPGSPLIGHRAAVTTITLSPDEKLLASGSEDGTVILWDVPAYQPLGQPLRSGRTDTGAVAFSPDGRRVAASSGPYVMLWDVTVTDRRACDAAKRNLTVAEWQTYLGTEAYRQTCPTLPSFGR